MIYYLIISILFAGSLLAQLNVKQAQLSGIKFFCILVIAIVGSLRYEVGYDWDSYQALYNGIDTLSDVFESREEPLFMLFLFVCKKIFANYSFFIFCFFISTFFIKILALQKLSGDIFFSLFIYITTIFLLYDLNGIRQGMALSIILYSIVFVLRRNLTGFLVCILLAYLFHKTALIFLPFYWISQIRFKINTLVYLMIGSVLISIPLKTFVFDHPVFQYLLTMDSFSQYSWYLEEGAEVNRSVSLVSIATIQRLLVWGSFVVFYKKIKLDEKIKSALFNGHTLSIILFIFLSFSAEFAARLTYYYKMIEIIIVPAIILSQVKLSNRILFLIFLSAFFFLSMYRLFSADETSTLIPYKIYPFF